MHAPNLHLLKTIRRASHARLGIEGIVKRVEVIHKPSGIIRRTLGPYKNLILDSGLDAILGQAAESAITIDDHFDYLAVGTDNTAPAAAQTTLGAEVGRTNTSGGVGGGVSIGPGNAYIELERSRMFDAGQVDGQNLTEFGFTRSAAGGTLTNRQLFRDESDDPTTIVLTAEEQLRVTIAYRIYPQTATATDVNDIDGTSTNVDSRAVQIDELSWTSFGDGMIGRLGFWSTDTRDIHVLEDNTMPATTGDLSTGGAVEPDAVNLEAYTPGSFFRDLEIVIGPTIANFATGIGKIYWLNMEDGFNPERFCAVTTFTPKVAKTNTMRYTHYARVSLARR